MSWSRIARSQAGVITRGQLISAGLTEPQVRSLLECGSVERVWDGVYLLRGAPWTYRSRLWASVLMTEGVLGFGTAAHLWGVIDAPPETIDVIVARPRHIWRCPGLRIHRVALAPDAVTTREGLTATNRRESILDYLGRLPRARAQQLADRAIQQHWLNPADFEHRLRTAPGRTGNRRLRELSALVTDGAAARSERILHAILRRSGIRGWRPNYEIRVGPDTFVVDVAMPEVMIAVEVDGMAFHTSPERFQRDRTKQNRITGLGWTVLRFTWADLVDRPAYVAETIRGAYARSRQ